MDKSVFKNLSYGMYVVGTKSSGNRNVGCIANSVCQITSSPSTIMVSLNHNNYTNKVISETKKFSVSILKEDTDSQVIGTFGYKSSLDTDKFENFDYEIKDNLPILKDNCGVLICEVIDVVETETHTVFFANVVDAFDYVSAIPMTYRYYHEVLKGKSPKNAPTYVEEKSNNKTKWRCKVCGYEVEMDELPEDYVCPICRVPVSMFEKVV